MMEKFGFYLKGYQEAIKDFYPGEWRNLIYAIKGQLSFMVSVLAGVRLEVRRPVFSKRIYPVI